MFPPKVIQNPETFDPDQILIELEKCANNFRYWASTYVYTYDVETRSKKHFADFKEKPEYRTHIYDYIDLLDKHYLTPREQIEHPDLLVVKSRQLYYSWANMTYLTWRMLFTPGFRALVTSKKADLCDIKNDFNTLLGKVDYILANLPTWMQPDVKDLRSKYLNRGILSIDSLICADAGDEPGRGSGFDIHLGDEWASQENTFTKLSALREAIKGFNIYLSTPQGKSNSFYHLYKQAKECPQESSIEILTPHWRLRRHSQYYQSALRKYNGDRSMLSQELDHSFEGPVNRGRVFDQFIYDRHTKLYTPVDFTPRQAVVGVDFGYAHAHAAVYVTPTTDGKYVVFDAYAQKSQVPEVHSRNMLGILATWKLDPKNAIYPSDPSGASHRQETGKSSYEYFAGYGIKCIPSTNSVLPGIQKINELFYKDILIINQSCTLLIDALNQAKYALDRNGEPRGEKYDESDYTDVLDALRYAIMYIYQPKQVTVDHLYKPKISGMGMGNISHYRR